MNKVLIVSLSLFVILTSGCDEPPKTAAQPALALAEQPSDFCSPYGNPMASSLRGANAFALCRTGDNVGNSAPLGGPITQYFIRCNNNTLRAGWKWVIYCNGDGTRCDCNRNSMFPSYGTMDVTNAQWSAGDHCTANGQARPGQNGCDAW
jgi:hypothetical protein